LPIPKNTRNEVYAMRVLYISYEPTFAELRNIILALDSKINHYTTIISLETGEVLADRVLNGVWEINR
jgi:hypothetical protein